MLRNIPRCIVTMASARSVPFGSDAGQGLLVAHGTG